MGLINSPEMFIWMMNSLFMDILEKGVVVFLDDVLIYNTILEEHFELMEKMFAPCVSMNFTAR